VLEGVKAEMSQVCEIIYVMMNSAHALRLISHTGKGVRQCPV